MSVGTIPAATLPAPAPRSNRVPEASGPQPGVADKVRRQGVELGQLPGGDPASAAPLTDRAQADPAPNPDIAQVFKTTMGVQLGDNRVIPIKLSQEKSEQYQKSLDAAGEALKTQIEVHLRIDTAKDRVTWYRYDPQTRSIVYQLNNQEQEYHISFKQIQKQQPFIDAMLKFDQELSAIHGISIKFVQYADDRVTLLRGPSPFDKSKDPALKHLADKSFEQALDLVNKRLARKKISPNAHVTKNFKDLKKALEDQLTHAKEHGQAALVKKLEALLRDIEVMDGFAVGLALALTLEPKDYKAAAQVRDQIKGIIPADQYTADIFGLYLQGHWDKDDEPRLQSIYSEVALSLHASKTHAGTEHVLLAYLKDRDLDTLKGFLLQRLGPLDTQADDPAATAIQEICSELEPDALP